MGVFIVAAGLILIFLIDLPGGDDVRGGPMTKYKLITTHFQVGWPSLPIALLPAQVELAQFWAVLCLVMLTTSLNPTNTWQIPLYSASCGPPRVMVCGPQPRIIEHGESEVMCHRSNPAAELALRDCDLIPHR